MTRILNAALIILLLATLGVSADLTDSLKPGTADLKSAGALAFGPDGVLFVADFYGATIFALDTQDRTPAKVRKDVYIKGIAGKIAALLGTAPNQILVNDVAVNPISGNTYASVARGRGMWPNALPVIVRIDAEGNLTPLSLENIKYSQVRLQEVTSIRYGRGGFTLEAITDLAFVDNHVYVAGLSNEEFSSDFRAIPFPFSEAGKATTVEIYHGSHGRYETRSPIRTFVPYKINGQTNILAAYTCTPLVRLPISSLKPGARVMGTTIAELGAANRPIDMMVYTKDGRDYLLMSNSSRGVLKLPANDLDGFEAITTPSDIRGVPYERIEGLSGIEQLKSYDDDRAIILERTESGSLDLRTISLP